jgi:hypothetical protein
MYVVCTGGDPITKEQMTVATAQAFQPGQIVYSQSGCTMTHVNFFVVDRVTAKSVWFRSISKFTTDTSHGQGTVVPNPLHQAPDHCVFRMKIQLNDDGSQCAFDRIDVYQIWNGQPCYVNSWD